MIRAYDESYLEDAMNCLGEAVDYASACCGISPARFMELFIGSGCAEEFGAGVPRLISGRSGTELAMGVLGEMVENFKAPTPQVCYTYSEEYWCGWILAFYQWYTGKCFEEILRVFPMEDIERLYPTLHEASEYKFADVADSIIRGRKEMTSLKRMRRLAGYSQRLLAMKSGVNLRTLQQYESGAKDINKASVTAVISLARVLGCWAEQLME